MTAFRLLPYRLSGILLLAAAFAPEARADIDRKFYEKAAKTVWSMDLPQFDPAADLSDSIYSDKAAVYIARYRSLKATHDESLNNAKASLTGISNTNAINAVGIDRSMVKILDPSALDDFNSFSITSPKIIDIYGLRVSSVIPSFGARLIKPDGTVENVDIAEALTVTEGKNNTDAGYKIAIPGLEPGTVLDYFFYTEYFMDEISMPVLKFEFFKEYPTKDFMLDLAISPTLAMEYAHNNGAPDFSRKWTEDSYNRLSLHLSGMEAIELDMPFFSEARQMPCIEFCILNNTGRLSKELSTRRGGVRIAAPYLLSDVASALKGEKYSEKTLKDATGIMKKWKKDHPLASRREIVDAAFIAMHFACAKNKERQSDRQFCKSFSRLLENLSITEPGRVAISSPRNLSMIDNLASYKEARYFVTVGDSCYFPLEGTLRVPGEIPPAYDGEKAYVYDCTPNNDLLQTAARAFTIPRSKPKDKIYETVSEVELKNDSIFDLKVNTTFTAIGTAKDILNGIIPPEDIYNAQANFLGQSPSKPRERDELEYTTLVQRKNMDELAKIIWNCDKTLLYDYNITSPGCTPDNPVAKFVIAAMLADMTTETGDDILVDIGKLTGRQLELKGSQRKRDISIIDNSAYLQRHTIRLKIPDGYEAVPQSVSALNRNISSPSASFFVNASVNDGYVVVSTVEIHPVSVAPASAWPDILKTIDAAYEFNSATIALRRLDSRPEAESAALQ